MRTALLLSSLAIAGMASAQIFQSGFETWTDGSPDGWMGSKTNIGAANVAQVTDNVHGGSSAVSLTNATSSHKRFTTQVLPVVNGQSYEVSFWVRGTGDIRVGLFDGRPGGSSGYATYSAYTAATTAWVQVTQTIVAGNDTTDAEFILSVRNTAAPDNLVVDDVTISEAGAPEEVSIYAIQYTTDASGDSPLAGQTVSTGGIVTGDLPDTGDGYFIQSGTGPWSGIYVYDADHAPAIGDSVTFTAAVSEYFGITELSGISNFTVVSSGNSVTPFDVATGDVSLEPLESVLVRVVDATCTVAPSGATFGKYNVDDGSGECVIGKAMYTTTPAPEVGQVFTIIGVNFYDFGEYNIQPRMASDVDLSTAVGEAGELATVAVGPNPAHDLLTIHLGDAAGQRVNYRFTDVQGRTVLTGQLAAATNRIDVADVPAGLYHLTLRTLEGTRTFAVQVVR